MAEHIVKSRDPMGDHFAGDLIRRDVAIAKRFKKRKYREK